MPIALSREDAGTTADHEQWPQNALEDSAMQIAIVGMACRLPGSVSNPESLWDLCLKAKDTWSKVPMERFSHETFYHPNPDRTNCVSQRLLTI